MKALVCEMCNSNDLVKQDGMFVCQHCGTKYTVEEAKKLMGTVKIDYSDELKNLYDLARRAKNDNNSENAQKFYEQILVKDPSSWEANFYSVYYQCLNTNIAGIKNAAITLNNCEDTILKMIKENETDLINRYNAVDEVGAKIIKAEQMLAVAASNHYAEIGDSIKSQYLGEALDRIEACYNALYNLGENILFFFSDDEKYSKEYELMASACWKCAIDIHEGTYNQSFKKTSNKEKITKYAEKIKKYEPNYIAPVLSTPTPTKSGGCYVATAVYGSYDCPQVWTLRRYRDDTLSKTWYGRAFIHTYYAISPTLVKWFGNTNWFKNMWKPKLDKMVNNLNSEGVDNTPYEDKQW